MKMNRYICLLLLYFVTFSIRGQEVKIIEKEKVNWSDYAVKVYKNQKEKIFKKPYKRLDSIDIFKIKYLSNGLKIEAFAAIPKKKKKYPVIVFNRGGNRNFNALGLFRNRENKGIGVVSYFSYLASKGYVVIGCNYRGGGNSEGKDQFGGEDVNDVLALLDVVKELPNIAADKIGLLGWSRGGMMAYKVLTQTNKIKTAVIGGAVSNSFKAIQARPNMETKVLAELIPNYYKNKEAALTKRSAIKWVNKFPKNVPIFLLHGSADWNVRATQSLELALEFQKYKIPYRLKIYEGGNHGISQFRKEKFKDIIGWFNKYLKKNTPLPNTNLINPYKKK